MKINNDDLTPKSLSHFENEYHDKQIACLHYNHFVKHRNKCLVRILERVQDKQIDLIQPNSVYDFSL